jgi:hypothetical protein
MGEPTGEYLGSVAVHDGSPIDFDRQLPSIRHANIAPFPVMRVLHAQS